MKKAAGFCLILAMSLPGVAVPQARESVPAELVRLQEETGLNLEMILSLEGRCAPISQF